MSQESVIRAEIRRLKKRIMELEAHLPKPLNLNNRTFDEYAAKRFRAKRGEVIYRIVRINPNTTTFTGRDWRPVSYDTPTVVLENVDSGNRRGVHLHDFNANYVEVKE